jgi:hypothetical protein
VEHFHFPEIRAALRGRDGEKTFQTYGVVRRTGIMSPSKHKRCRHGDHPLAEPEIRTLPEKMVTFTYCRRAGSQGIRAATLGAYAGVMTKKEYERLEKSRGNGEQMGNHARQMRIDASTIRKNTVQSEKDAKAELRKLP